MENVEAKKDMEEHSGDEHEVENPEIHFEPLIHLPEIDVKTLEEDENILWKARAKLYRFVNKYDEQYSTGPQWKERGIGEVKFLQHKTKGCVRLIMRREQTLTLCANHYILPDMKLRQHNTSNRSWMWSTVADFSEFEPRAEVLAIRFKDVDTWKEFEFEFENAKLLMEAYQKKLESICGSSLLPKKSENSKPPSSTSQNLIGAGDGPAQKFEETSEKAPKNDQNLAKNEEIAESVAKLSIKSEEK